MLSRQWLHCGARFLLVRFFGTFGDGNPNCPFHQKTFKGERKRERTTRRCEQSVSNSLKLMKYSRALCNGEVFREVVVKAVIACWDIQR